MVETAKTSALVFIILLGAAMLTAAFRAFGGEELVKEFLTNLPGGFWAQFVIVMAVIFILGFFLDFIEIAVVVVPIVAPILLMDPSANITAVWLGVMIGLNIQTSFLTPPFGFALFYLRGVAPAVVRTVQMYKGVVPFICLQLVALVIVGQFPALVNYLPTRNLLTSETAPPPRNPSMQHCIEQYNFEQFETKGEAIRAAIGTAQSLDVELSAAPSRRRPEAGFRCRGGGLCKRRRGQESQRLHSQRKRPNTVRYIARSARSRNACPRSSAKIKEREQAKRGSGQDKARVAELDREIARLKQDQKALEATIPGRWAAENKAFVALQKADDQRPAQIPS